MVKVLATCADTESGRICMKILIVDDDPVSQAVLREIVTATGEHQVTTAGDGAAAWALLDDASRSFDVAFLDISMPELDGFELLLRIRRSPLLSSTEVVLCTGANDRATIAKAIQFGARHYVVKPCSAPIIAAKLKQIGQIVERRLAGAT